MEKLVTILPSIIVAESFGAAIIYAIGGKWGSAIYWISAGWLTLAVTYLIKKLG